MHLCECVCMRVCVRPCVRAYMCARARMCMGVCMRVYMHVCVYSFVYPLYTCLQIMLYRKRGKIRWAKLSWFSQFLRVPQKFSREFLAIGKQ